MRRLFVFMRENWKLSYALVVVYGFAYNIILWAPIMWATTVATLVSGYQFPAPPLLPYEYLLAASANLGLIGTIQLFKRRGEKDA